MGQPRAPSSLARVWVLLAAAGLALLHAFHFHHTCDDAFISFRYAHNLAAGHGLVFNPGERVMGYSDLLWVLALAGADALHLDLPKAAAFLSTLCAWATLALVFFHLRRASPHGSPVLVALGLLVANGTFALWMFGGLEGHLFTALLVFAVLKTLDTPDDARPLEWAKVGLALGLASLTRPEGIMYVAPVALSLVLRGGRAALPRAVLVSAVAGSMFAAASLWQFAYYGSFVPNTYHAKHLPLSGPLLARGLDLSLGFLRAYSFVPVMVVVGWWVSARPTRRARGWLPLLMLATFFAFYLSIGGDVLVYFRMWLVTLPLFALLAAETVERLEALQLRWKPQWVLGAVLVALTLPASFVGWSLDYLRSDDAALADLKLVGQRLRRLPPETVIAANVVGILTFESGLQMVDMLGLNDAHIARVQNKTVGIPAHESHDGAYVLSRKPDLIFPGVAEVSSAPQPVDALMIYPSDRDLLALPAFAQDYRLVAVPLGRRGLLQLFVRNDFAAQHDVPALLGGEPSPGQGVVEVEELP